MIFKRDKHGKVDLVNGKFARPKAELAVSQPACPAPSPSSDLDRIILDKIGSNRILSYYKM